MKKINRIVAFIIFSIFIVIFVVLIINKYSYLGNTSINKIKQVSLSWLVDNNNEDFINYYKEVKTKEKINVFTTIYESFKNIDSLDKFISFDKEFKNELLFAFFLKLNDKASWEKFWAYKFDFFIIENDKDFLVTIKNFWNSRENQKIKFIEFMWNLFDEFSTIDKLDDKDYDIDLKVYFNNLPINEALSSCNKLAKTNKLYSDTNSCRDNIYNYRATIENWFCSNIKEEFKKVLCIDFLSYKATIKN